MPNAAEGMMDNVYDWKIVGVGSHVRLPALVFGGRVACMGPLLARMQWSSVNHVLASLFNQRLRWRHVYDTLLTTRYGSGRPEPGHIEMDADIALSFASPLPT